MTPSAFTALTIRLVLAVKRCDWEAVKTLVSEMDTCRPSLESLLKQGWAEQVAENWPHVTVSSARDVIDAHWPKLSRRMCRLVEDLIFDVFGPPSVSPKESECPSSPAPKSDTSPSPSGTQT